MRSCGIFHGIHVVFQVFTNIMRNIERSHDLPFISSFSDLCIIYSRCSTCFSTPVLYILIHSYSYSNLCIFYCFRFKDMVHFLFLRVIVIWNSLLIIKSLWFARKWTSLLTNRSLWREIAFIDAVALLRRSLARVSAPPPLLCIRSVFE